jgi:hypothetical protein
MTSESHFALETHPTYPTFRSAVPGHKSFSCWTVLTTIHSAGNASTKLLRTRLLLNSQQSDSTLSQFLQTLSQNIDQFKTSTLEVPLTLSSYLSARFTASLCLLVSQAMAYLTSPLTTSLPAKLTQGLQIRQLSLQPSLIGKSQVHYCTSLIRPPHNRQRT